MCGRYVLYGPGSRLVEGFDLRATPPLLPRYNIAPGSPVLAILQGPEGRRAQTLRWGLKRNGSVPNVRDDSVAKPWAWRLMHERCVLPADGFYEWQAPNDPGARKQPWYVSASSGGFLAFAGVLGHWDEAGVALFTTGPNGTMRPIHERMPVLLDAAGVARWLDPHTPAAQAAQLLRPAPDAAIRAWPVSTAVNDAHHEGAQLIERLPGEPGEPG
ncbi:SOS response-associated peptidase [Quisquiliibacterium transsilvanicum]|uniref:Abasic site processing protein n=1 Tax=Quisquiliibacterium transsilvanicum TaxID=1549638 RepID=A0A7W8HG90_9BURK|nr:SOS response-associated peptidase [Quisquiliibacterium transsilvanicum]MBB5270683.1 putative SOS response-associated peptidase YedK [Quisquiliibacterium transsilvanicum]